MHDIRAIRADPAGFDAAMARRGLAPVSQDLLAKDARRRAILAEKQDWQARRNAASKQIGQALREGRQADAASLRAELETAFDTAQDSEADALERAIKDSCSKRCRTSSMPTCRIGADESANVVLAQHGEPRDLGFQPKQHFELGETLGMMDFAAATKMAGARFTVLRGLWRGWNGRSGNSCWTCTRASMAIPRPRSRFW